MDGNNRAIPSMPPVCLPPALRSHMHVEAAGSVRKRPGSVRKRKCMFIEIFEKHLEASGSVRKTRASGVLGIALMEQLLHKQWTRTMVMNCDHQCEILSLGITRMLGLEIGSHTTLPRSILWMWLRLGLSHRLRELLAQHAYI